MRHQHNYTNGPAPMGRWRTTTMTTTRALACHTPHTTGRPWLSPRGARCYVEAAGRWLRATCHMSLFGGGAWRWCAVLGWETTTNMVDGVMNEAPETDRGAVVRHTRPNDPATGLRSKLQSSTKHQVQPRASVSVSAPLKRPSSLLPLKRGGTRDDLDEIRCDACLAQGGRARARQVVRGVNNLATAER